MGKELAAEAELVRETEERGRAQARWSGEGRTQAAQGNTAGRGRGEPRAGTRCPRKVAITFTFFPVTLSG